MTDLVKQGWSEQAMQDALARLVNGKHSLHIPPHADDEDMVLDGTIDEVIALRAKVAQLRAVAEAARKHVSECRCKGTGKVGLGCRFCGDSTYEHDCEEVMRECTRCLSLRIVLAELEVRDA